MAFILTAATTHFTLSNEKVPDVYKELEDTSKVSQSSKFLFDKVSKLNNDWPLEPVRRAYILSTDDTSEYVFQGEGNKKDSTASFKLVSRDALSRCGTHSKFITGGSEIGSGLRVTA